jgi:serine/threonine protein kinase/class 3 adenylate cyclase
MQGHNTLPTDDGDIPTEIAVENSQPVGHTNANRTGVPRFLLTPDPTPTLALGKLSDFKEDDLGDDVIDGTASSAGSPTAADGSAQNSGSCFIGPVRINTALLAIAVGAIVFCIVYVFILLLLVNADSRAFGQQIERDFTATMFSGNWTLGEDWSVSEDARYFTGVASPQSERYMRSILRVIESFACATHGAVERASKNYLISPGTVQATRDVDSVFWAGLVHESILIPNLASAFLISSLLTTTVVSLPPRAGNTNFFVGLHMSCNMWNTAATRIDTTCVTVSFKANISDHSPTFQDLEGRSMPRLSGDALEHWGRLLTELESYDPSSGPTVVIRNQSLILLTDLPRGGAVASILPMADIGKFVRGYPCRLCSVPQQAQIDSLRRLVLHQSVFAFYALAAPSSLLQGTAEVEPSFGDHWPPLAGADEDLRSLQVLAAANVSRGFSDGPISLGDRRLLVRTSPLSVLLRTATVTAIPQNIHVLLAQDVSGALEKRNSMMERVLKGTTNLRNSVVWTSVGVGISFLFLCCVLGINAVRFIRELSDGIAAVVDNLHCARSMELEKATTFVPNSEQGLPSSELGDEDVWSVSFPRVQTLRMSNVAEARRLQEAMNHMFTSLRDYRKFLPSTLFLKGEVPLQEELAEELLLGGLEGGGTSRPASFRMHSPVHPPSTSPRSSPLKGLPMFKVSSAKASPSTMSLKPFSASTSPRGSRIHHAEDGPFFHTEENASVKNTVGQVATGQHDGGSLAFCLKRRKATILTVSFMGFLRAAQEDVGEAHRASQTFLQIVLSVVDRNDGIVLSLLPDKVVATWNAFRTDATHEANGAMCAYELNRTLQAADEEFLFSEHQVAICVTSGPVVAGNTGTTSERASVVHGDCVNLCNELLSLLVAINVRCAVTRPVAERLPPLLWSLPIDVVTDEDESVHEVFELRSGEEAGHIQLIRQGFHAFVAQDYSTAKELFGEAVKASIPRVEPNAMRLLKLSAMFAKLQTPYVRALPAWQRFEMDQATGDAAEPSPKRRYKSEKRKSQLADEQLRLELMNLRNTANASPALNSSRLSVVAGEPPQHSPRSAGLTAANSPQPARRRSKTSPLDDSLSVHQAPGAASTPRRASAVMPPIISQDVPPMFRPAVTEFRDRKDMLFRMSTHVLGRGAVGEVLMGMSESGGLVAIKSVPLPGFIRNKQGPQEEPSVSGLSEIQKRRLKRKGVNVNANIEQDLDAMLNEVAMLSRLRHENIVGYLSSAIVDGKLLVVMEYISGGSLHSLISEFKGMPAMTAKRYLRDTLKGLHYLHAADIVHRDIKPQNVLILIDGSCKLTDFGTSQRLSKLSSTSTMEGTPQYMAPEASKGRAEKASDVWSFGILMAQLLTGELPWPNDGCFIPMRFIYMLGNDDKMIPMVSQLSPDAQEIVRWCCTRDPAKRPTVDELLAQPYFASATTASPIGLRGTTKRRADRGRSSMPRSDGGGASQSQDLPFGRTSGKLRESSQSNTTSTNVTLFKFSAFEDGPMQSPSRARDIEQHTEDAVAADEEPDDSVPAIPAVIVEAPED